MILKVLINSTQPLTNNNNMIKQNKSSYNNTACDSSNKNKIFINVNKGTNMLKIKHLIFKHKIIFNNLKFKIHNRNKYLILNY